VILGIKYPSTRQGNVLMNYSANRAESAAYLIPLYGGVAGEMLWWLLASPLFRQPPRQPLIARRGCHPSVEGNKIGNYQTGLFAIRHF
jgi:hypothetical protein